MEITTYCKNCVHVMKQSEPKEWLCKNTAKMTTLGINAYLHCIHVNDDFKCSRFKPKWWIKLLQRIKK